MWAIWKTEIGNGKQLINWVFSAYPNILKAGIDKVAGMGLGYIWRKTDGQILAAGQIYRNEICSAKMAEAWAILEALKNPPAEVTNPIEVQTDCRVVGGRDQQQGSTSLG
ncbi:hypothetical protein F8388_002067 [Cannabis sativa]|uniref:RNase H type-1 domain-containing protein n=1 Tax=Cannabis sativa TaxID=3483 RepID=A0A7J6E381_CANSA|nr:hypothetical protein F8388_002067 [Cannabis sativa]